MGHTQKSCSEDGLNQDILETGSKLCFSVGYFVLGHSVANSQY